MNTGVGILIPIVESKWATKICYFLTQYCRWVWNFLTRRYYLKKLKIPTIWLTKKDTGFLKIKIIRSFLFQSNRIYFYILSYRRFRKSNEVWVYYLCRIYSTSHIYGDLNLTIDPLFMLWITDQHTANAITNTNWYIKLLFPSRVAIKSRACDYLPQIMGLYILYIKWMLWIIL